MNLTSMDQKLSGATYILKFTGMSLRYIHHKSSAKENDDCSCSLIFNAEENPETIHGGAQWDYFNTMRLPSRADWRAASSILTTIRLLLSDERSFEDFISP